MKRVVFLGPSLPLGEARAIVDAVYLPPAGQADLVSAVTTYRPDVIGLIDGVFLQEPAVWHKEILYALASGVRVYGSSSMGALRAAETAAYGMVGVGEIYRMYAAGELVDDDEVALAYGEGADGWRKLSEPMVNVRATLAAAHDAGLLDREALERLVAIAKSIYFGERSFAAVFAKARAAGLRTEVIARLEPYVRSAYVDVKRRDARLLLQALRDLDAGTVATVERPRFNFAASRLHEALYDRDRTVRHQTVDVPLASLARHAALHLTDFSRLNFHALNRALVQVLAELLAVEPGEDDIEHEERRWRMQVGAETEPGLHAWLLRHHLSAAEWHELMRQMATCRVLQRSLLVGFTFKGSTRVVLDELRLSGRYEPLLAQAAAHERILRAHEETHEEDHSARPPLADLLAEHMQETACRLDTDPITWAEEVGFTSVDELATELLDARRVRAVMRRVLEHLELARGAAGGGDEDAGQGDDDTA